MKRYPTRLSSCLNLFYRYLDGNKFPLVYLPLAVYWIILFIVTTIPIVRGPRFYDYQDKIEHFLAYFGLAVLLAFALHFQKKFARLSSGAFFFTFIFVASYGAFDELHQMLVPGRYCELYDWLADIFGGLCGIGAAYLFLRNRSLNSPGMHISDF